MEIHKDFLPIVWIYFSASPSVIEAKLGVIAKGREWDRKSGIKKIKNRNSNQSTLYSSFFSTFARPFEAAGDSIVSFTSAIIAAR